MPAHAHPPPPSICPYCDSLLKFHGDPDTGAIEPAPGDVTFCVHCARVLTFNARLQMVGALPHDLERICQKYPGFGDRYNAAFKGARDRVRLRDRPPNDG